PRAECDAATETKKKPPAPQSSEPPYFTTKAGSPRPKPNPRKDRPDIIIKRQSQARTINTGPRKGSRVRRFEDVFMPAADLLAAWSTRRLFPVRNRAGESRRHGHPAWLERWP